jgi:8-oxo-dGTP pyrophosphatase MutT (NUDIX family)
LSQAETPRRIRPKHAASLLVVEASGPEPRLLMGRRNAAQAFMPGVFVFPGGRVDRSDYRSDLRAVGLAMRERLAREGGCVRASLPDALLAAAIRELAEETGFVIDRERLTGISFIARAITPPHLSRRFDTRFFLVDRGAIHEERAGAIGPEREFTELRWVTIEEARRLPIPAVTALILDAAEARLAGADDLRPVPVYRRR